MPLTPVIQKRHGKEYRIFKGVNPDNGKRENYFETDDEPNEHEQTTRWWFKRMVIDGKSGTGEVVQIVTTWEKGLVSPNGVPHVEKPTKLTMITRDYDLAGFLLSPLAEPISIYLQNGAWKSDKIMGHTHLKPFNPATGAVIEYSEFLQNAAPTYDYATWNPGQPLPNSLDEFYVPPVEEPDPSQKYYVADEGTDSPN